MTDTIEAVARAIDPEAWAYDLPIPTRADTVAFHDRRQRSNSLARIAIAAHTKALIDGAGDVERLRAEQARMYAECREGGPRSYTTWAPDIIGQAAATIAALRAEIMRLTRAAVLSELAAADAELLDYATIADSDGDDGA